MSKKYSTFSIRLLQLRGKTVVIPFDQYDITHAKCNEGVSICVTAWHTQDYIEECLDSIEKQSYFKNFDKFEVLVAVDGCEETLNKLKEIKHKYRKIKVYYSHENKGTYVLSNTLMSMAKYKYIIRFDSDDIMCEDMVYEIMSAKKGYDIVRYSYLDFIDGEDIKQGKMSQTYAFGTIMADKKFFKKFGGYRPLPCAADSDFLSRTKKFAKVFYINTPLFYRRRHSESLTTRPETNMQSAIRNEIRKTIHVANTLKEAKIKMVTTELVEVI